MQPVHPSSGEKAGKTLQFLSWNVVGVTAKNMLDILEDFRGSRELSSTDAVLVQEIITEPGLFHDESEHWQIVYGKCDGEFRGEAIAHRATHFSHHQSQCILGAVATTIKLRQTSASFRTLAGHIPHHATIAAAEDMLTSWGEQLRGSRVVAGMDANETFATPSTTTTGGAAHTGRGTAWACSTGPHTTPSPSHRRSYTSRHTSLTTKHYNRADWTTFSPKGSQQRRAMSYTARTAPLLTMMRYRYPLLRIVGAGGRCGAHGGHSS